jgi:hypothetical protein
MRTIPFCTALCVALLPLQAQEQGEAAKAVASADSVVFTYEKLPSEPGRPDITGREGAVDFALYYVERDCGEYDYAFSKEKHTLNVTQVVSSMADCAADEDNLYAVRGTITGLSAGKHLLRLKFGDATSDTTIFQEVVRVK